MDNLEIYYRLNKNNRSKKIIGVPPLSFVSNGENLVDYKIYGNTVSEESVGELVTEGEHSGQYCIPIVVAGKNLFDENTVTEDAFLYVNDGTVRKSSSGTANVSGYIPTKKSRKYILTFSAESVPNGFSTVVCYYNTSKQYTQQRNSFTISSSRERYFFELVPQNDGYIRVKYPSSAFNLQVEDSDSDTDYEPHYESQTAAIYLNEPLAEGESISSRSAGVSIPTINGTTILSVDTIVQPSHIYIKYGDGGSDNSSLLKYLKYKYKYAKE